MNDPEDMFRDIDEALFAEPGTPIDDELRQRITEHLRQSPDARRHLVTQRLLDAALELESATGTEPLASVEAKPPAANRESSLRRWRGFALVAALALATGMLLTSLLRAPTAEAASTEANEPTEPTDDSIAILREAHDVTWAATTLQVEEDRDAEAVGHQPDDLLSPGRLALDTGLVQIEFYSGARLLVEGPAELELIDRDSVICHRGKLRAHVPTHAKGFTVHSPKFELVDLGTEFGVEVEPDGDARVQVFDGKVDVYSPDGKRSEKSKRHLLKGEALVWKQSDEPADASLTPEDFVSFSRVQELSRDRLQGRFTRWEKWNENVQADDRVIAHYNFQGEDAVQLTDHVGRHHGTIVGSVRADGRFPGKGALEFKRTSDRVRINVPGSYGQLTLSTWIRMDAQSGRAQSLILTDGYEHGRIHWQVSRDRKLRLGMKWNPGEGHHRQGATGYGTDPLFGPQRMGKWCFVCTVYDNEKRVVSHYLNGKRVSQDRMIAAREIAIGSAEIGNWNPANMRRDKQGLPTVVRNFVGRIDELTLWNAALDAAEIRRIYRSTCL